MYGFLQVGGNVYHKVNPIGWTKPLTAAPRGAEYALREGTEVDEATAALTSLDDLTAVMRQPVNKTACMRRRKKKGSAPHGQDDGVLDADATARLLRIAPTLVSLINATPYVFAQEALVHYTTAKAKQSQAHAHQARQQRRPTDLAKNLRRASIPRIDVGLGVNLANCVVFVK